MTFATGPNGTSSNYLPLGLLPASQIQSLSAFLKLASRHTLNPGRRDKRWL